MLVGGVFFGVVCVLLLVICECECGWSDDFTRPMKRGGSWALYVDFWESSLTTQEISDCSELLVILAGMAHFHC